MNRQFFFRKMARPGLNHPFQMHNAVANGVDAGFGAVLHFQFLEQGFGMGGQ